MQKGRQESKTAAAGGQGRGSQGRVRRRGGLAAQPGARAAGARGSHQAAGTQRAAVATSAAGSAAPTTRGVCEHVALDLQVLPHDERLHGAHLQARQRVLGAKHKLASVLADLVKEAGSRGGGERQARMSREDNKWHQTVAGTEAQRRAGCTHPPLISMSPGQPPSGFHAPWPSMLRAPSLQPAPIYKQAKRSSKTSKAATAAPIC